jgi:hypothetical protein
VNTVLQTLAPALRRLLPGVWAGVLWCIALVATPAPFAQLAQADAGRVVARIFAQEAALSVGMAAGLFALEWAWLRTRSPHPGWRLPSMLVALALTCTLLGYYGLQPMLAQARMGLGPMSFGQLHAVSLLLFGLKLVAVSVLAWRVAGRME